MAETNDGTSRITTASRPGGSLHGWGRFWRIIGILGCVVSMAAGTLFGFMFFGSTTFGEYVRKHGLLSPNIVYATSRQFPGVKSLNVLVLGVDRDYDNQQRVLKTNGRSDSILLAHVDFEKQTINAVTIPRDTAIRIPGRRGLHKINAAHQFGGPDLLIETIQQAFGVKADTWVAINFHGFVKVVDALGGVDVNVHKRLKYDDNWGNLHINLYPGFQHLTGYQAMGYVRMRHSDSDEMRSQRQHEFLEAVRAKIKSPAIFPELPAIIDEISYALKRAPGLTKDQMMSLANFARNLPRTSINIETMPSYEGPSYVTIDSTRSAELIQRMFYPGQPGSVTVDVPGQSDVRALNSRYGRRNRSTKEKDATETAPGNGNEVLDQPGTETTDEGGTEGTGNGGDTGGTSGGDGGGTSGTDTGGTGTGGSGGGGTGTGTGGTSGQ